MTESIKISKVEHAELPPNGENVQLSTPVEIDKGHISAPNGKVEIAPPSNIVKRDSRVVVFDDKRIEAAITRCFDSFGKQPDTSTTGLTKQVVNIAAVKYEQPTVEQIQDIVEMVLQAAGEYEAAKRYILYRAEHAKLRAERPVPEEIRQAFAEADAYFPTPLQKFQFFDKYARFSYELGRRETWIETVDRAVDFLEELSESRLPPETYQCLRRGILEMQAMPSMRLIAMAGPAARRSNITIYNCSYLPVDSIESFVEALVISMSGCGVGYSVERQYVEKFPRIRRQLGTEAEKLVIEDSSEGWAEAVRLGIQSWFDGKDVQFDYSLIRPAGTPLLTKGGRASGPEPLRKMINYTRNRILSRQGSFLRSIDAHDIMCMVGNAAVSGGVRRTAMIALFDFDDQEMQMCKSGENIVGNEQRWNANNSAVWPDRELNQAEITRYLLDMVESGRGEPGIFSRLAAKSTLPSRRKFVDFGTNPCVTGETWVMTSDGPRQVSDLEDRSFDAIVDGEGWQSAEDGFRFTGNKPVYLIETEEGYTLKATADHPIRQVTHQSRKLQRFEWTAAGSLQPGDLIRVQNHRGLTWKADDHGPEIAWLLGSLVGDGTFAQFSHKSDTVFVRYWGEPSMAMAERAHGMSVRKIEPHSDVQPVWNRANQFWQVGCVELADVAAHYGIIPGEKTVTSEIERTSSAFYTAFLRGLFDAEGTVGGPQEKGVSVRLPQSNLELLKAVQRMLLRLGIVSTVYQERRPEGWRELLDGKGGYAEYWTKVNHELVIGRDNLQEFQKRVGFSDPAKAARLSDLLSKFRRKTNRERFSVRVKSVAHLGNEDVFDCSIPDINAFDANGLYVHNCGEILLRPFEFCNLSIAVARPDDTFETLKEKVELATIIGTIQSMATHFPGLRPQWQQNCEEERLLGVDINGQMDSPVARDPVVQARLQEFAVETNRRYAEMLGINPSVSVTCVKPSGNSSQLLDCSPGVHARWSKFYIRNVRVGALTPLFKVLKDLNVPMDPENGQSPEDANTWVVHFPVQAPENAITRIERSALEQCKYWLQLKTHWTEHNPSVTITYQPDEVIDIIKWVWEHQDKIGGMTFLPSFDAQYTQMPYEEILQEEYERLVAKFPEIDFSKLYRYEKEDYTTAAQELACFGGSCEIEL